MTTKSKKKQTRKSVSMPGYVYDAFAVACEAAGVPMAAQNERLVREWLATQTGEVPAAPSKPARAKKEKPTKPARAKKPSKRSKAKDETGDVPPTLVSEERTETGVLYKYSNGVEIEHLDEPTEEMEAAAGEALAEGTITLAAVAVAEPEPEEDEFIDDRAIVAEDEFVDDDGGVAF